MQRIVIKMALRQWIGQARIIASKIAEKFNRNFFNASKICSLKIKSGNLIIYLVIYKAEMEKGTVESISSYCNKRSVYKAQSKKDQFCASKMTKNLQELTGEKWVKTWFIL